MTIYNKSAAKCFANFSTSGTPSFRDSLGFSGITDDGTGRHRLNFSPNDLFGDTDWCAIGATEKNDTNDDHNQLVTIGCTGTNRRVNGGYVPITNGRSRHSGHCDTAYSFVIVFSN